VRLVLDASVTVSWLLKRIDPVEIAVAQRSVEYVQRYGARVPAIWPTEIANAILTAERKGISTPAATAKLLADLATLDIQLEPGNHPAIQRSTINLARSLNLTAYDATYLELALRTGCSLATFDRQLADAFRRVGGHVFGDNTP
jgi:predicted nucleic acid-binding protein